MLTYQRQSMHSKLVLRSGVPQMDAAALAASSVAIAAASAVVAAVAVVAAASAAVWAGADCCHCLACAGRSHLRRMARASATRAGAGCCHCLA